MRDHVFFTFEEIDIDRNREKIFKYVFIFDHAVHLSPSLFSLFLECIVLLSKDRPSHRESILLQEIFEILIFRGGSTPLANTRTREILLDEYIFAFTFHSQVRK